MHLFSSFANPPPSPPPPTTTTTQRSVPSSSSSSSRSLLHTFAQSSWSPLPFLSFFHFRPHYAAQTFPAAAAAATRPVASFCVRYASSRLDDECATRCKTARCVADAFSIRSPSVRILPPSPPFEVHQSVVPRFAHR